MSNRGRQNVASFLALDLGLDWRWGADWFESLLLDYDVCRWGACMHMHMHMHASQAWLQRVRGGYDGLCWQAGRGGLVFRRPPSGVAHRAGHNNPWCTRCPTPPPVAAPQQLGQLGGGGGADGRAREQVQHHQAEQREGAWAAFAGSAHLVLPARASTPAAVSFCSALLFMARTGL